MTFLTQPVTDLIVPLYGIARGNQQIRQEATEKFIQAACRTGLAGAVFFIGTMAERFIHNYTDPFSNANVLGRIGALLIIYGFTTTLHPHAATLARTLHHSFVGLRAYQLPNTPNFYRSLCLDLIAVIYGLYATSKTKSRLFQYKLDGEIIHLSQNLASYLTPR